MRTRQGERSLSVVIENPCPPRTRVVTTLAFTAQCSAVCIVIFVTRDTCLSGIMESGRSMAFVARAFCMRADQREIRQVVIEAHLGGP